MENKFGIEIKNNLKRKMYNSNYLQDFLSRNPQYGKQINRKVYFDDRLVSNERTSYIQNGRVHREIQPKRYGDSQLNVIQYPNTTNGKRNWESFVQGKKSCLVVVYADWCGHCKDMKKKLGHKIAGNDRVLFIEEKNLPNNLNVSGFPTVIRFSNGREVERSHDTNIVVNAMN